MRRRHQWTGIFALRTHQWGGVNKEASLRTHQCGGINEKASLRTHQRGAINKEAFHIGTPQWPPLYCGSLASKTLCKMRWCLWNKRESLLLGGSIEWLWLLSRQASLHWGHINKKASVWRHFTLELYNSLHSTVVHWHLRLLVRCDDAFEIWEEVSCWEE